MKPSTCIIITGHNDAFFGENSLIIARTIAAIAEVSRINGITPIVCGPIPVFSTPTTDRTQQAHTLSDLNIILYRFTSQSHVAFVNAQGLLHAKEADATGFMDMSTGNHLNDTGYDILAKGVFDLLKHAH